MAHDLMQRWSQDYNVQLNPKGVVVQWMPLARALVRSRWHLCMHELGRHTHWPARIWDAGQEGPQVHWGLPRLPEPAPHVRAICHDGLHLHWEWRRPPDPAPYVGATGHDGPHGQEGAPVCGATGDGSGRALRPFGKSSFAGADRLMGGTGEAALSPALPYQMGNEAPVPRTLVPYGRKIQEGVCRVSKADSHLALPTVPAPSPLTHVTHTTLHRRCVSGIVGGLRSGRTPRGHHNCVDWCVCACVMGMSLCGGGLWLDKARRAH